MTPITVTCKRCQATFLRYGARESSHFSVSAEDARLCICCREQLDPDTLTPITRGRATRDVSGREVGTYGDY